MSNLVTLLAAGAPPRFVAAANRNLVPYNYAATGNGNHVKNNRIMFRASALNAVRNLRVTYANWYANATGGESVTGLLPFNLRAGLEYPLGVFYPIQFGGQATRLMELGDTVESDAVPVSVPPGETFYIRTWREHIGVSGSYNELVNQIVAPGRNEGNMSGTDNTVDRTLGGTITAVAGLNQVYGPMLVRGMGTGAGASSLLILSDSIGRGSGDKTGTTGQGDYLSGASPTAPYINIGNVGWIERAIGGRHPWLSLAVPGKLASSYTELLAPKQWLVADKIQPSHVIICIGVNDLMQGATGAQVITRIQSIMALARARWKKTKCYVGTIFPVTNSSDSWATPGNQFLSGVLAATGSTPTWSNFTDNSGISGRSYANAQIRANLIGADGIIDGAAQAEDASDARLWRTDLGQPSGDGIHPTPELHLQAMQALNAQALFG